MYINYLNFIKKYNDKEVIVFDTETTGVSKTDKIVQFSAQRCLLLDNYLYRLPGKEDKLDIYLKIPFKMPFQASQVNGITDNLLKKKGLNRLDAAKIIYDFLYKDNEEVPVLGQNIPFDIRMTDRLLFEELGIHYFPLISIAKKEDEKVIDTLKMARDRLPDAPNHKLETLAKIADLKDLSFHNSAEDVKATIGVFNHLSYLYKDERENINTFLGNARGRNIVLIMDKNLNPIYLSKDAYERLHMSKYLAPMKDKINETWEKSKNPGFCIPCNGIYCLIAGEDCISDDALNNAIILLSKRLEKENEKCCISDGVNTLLFGPEIKDEFIMSDDYIEDR